METFYNQLQQSGLIDIRRDTKNAQWIAFPPDTGLIVGDTPRRVTLAAAQCGAFRRNRILYEYHSTELLDQLAKVIRDSECNLPALELLSILDHELGRRLSKRPRAATEFKYSGDARTNEKNTACGPTPPRPLGKPSSKKSPPIKVQTPRTIERLSPPGSGRSYSESRLWNSIFQ